MGTQPGTSAARNPGAAADSGPQPPPAAGGGRLAWEALPGWLRQAVERQLGSPVATAVTQPGGFSPGAAARLRLADGRRAFVKAAGPEPNPESPGIHRSEARVAAALPAAAPTPRLLGSIDSGGWVALIFEDIDGAMPAQPWQPAELARVLAALALLAETLTPAPVDAPPVAERFGEEFQGWRLLAGAHHQEDDDLPGLDPWARRHLSALAELESGWETAAAGPALIHADLRADNLLLTPGGVVVVDWPWACLAAPWVDLLAMLPSVRMQGGPPPEDIFRDHPVSRSAGPRAVTATLAAITGFFVERSRQPPPPGIPALRAFQAAQGEVALAWLRERTGWR